MPPFITGHAIDRYLERTGKRQVAEQRIQAIIENGKTCKPKNPALKIISHGFEEAIYYHDGGFVVAVVDDRAVTVMRPIKGAWIF